MSDWRKSAACAGYDPELWFPGNSQLMRREAIQICHTCPVMMQCRKYAETNIDFLTGLKSRDSCCRSDVSFLMEEIPTGIAGV